jgi:hypothetical protein
MRIDATEFGAVTIDAKTYEHDVIIRLSGPGGRQHDSAELEAPATGLVDDLPAVHRDVAQGVALVVVLPIGKGSDFGEQGFEPAPGIAFGRRTKPS